MMVRSYLQQGYSIAKADQVEGFEGAISFGLPGMYKNVFKLDVAALYPSIMRHYKIYNKSKDPHQHFNKMVEYFTKERLKNKQLAKETNKKFYKDLEQSQKVMINSKYGFLGAPGLNYNSPRHAAIVTKYGREILAKGVLFATGKEIQEWKSLISEEKDADE
jgi:DNA polymerase elongation subunit (family B)